MPAREAPPAIPGADGESCPRRAPGPRRRRVGGHRAPPPGRRGSGRGRGSRLVARRRRRLDELVAEMADGLAVEADVRDPDAGAHVVEEVVSAFGGLDAVVYAAAVTRLGDLVDADAEVWQDVLATNLVGASLVLRAACAELTASGGRALVLSSDSVAYPFPGLGPYAASKAALDKLIEAWRGEHPDVGITRVIIGPTATEAASSWDPDLAGRYFEVWAERGLLADAVIPQQAEQVADRLVELLAAPEIPDDVELFPPGMASTLEDGSR
ncbi:MAG: SDR family oxidoreductase [Acidimicrobiia bacterium]|nr:SDR family oxidoreductase [Acidimicrobiia bacterium]